MFHFFLLALFQSAQHLIENREVYGYGSGAGPYLWLMDPDPRGPKHPDWKTWNWRNLQLNKKLDIFLSKIAIYLSLGLHKGRTSYKRSLQPSKENIQHFKTWISQLFFCLCGSFFPSGSDQTRVLDPDSIRLAEWEFGSGSRQAKIVFQKRKKCRKFMF